MAVRRAIAEPDGVYFITITCMRWLPLFKMLDAWQVVYNWFDQLKKEGHFVIGYVIMPDHLHAIIAFSNVGKSINSIVGTGKRFMAYSLVKLVHQQGRKILGYEMQQVVNSTDRKRNKIHEVFEPSFDSKECSGERFMEQKLNYIHLNPCRSNPRLSSSPEEYVHSSARYYIKDEHGIYPVTSFMELMDIDLTNGKNLERVRNEDEQSICFQQQAPNAAESAHRKPGRA